MGPRNKIPTPLTVQSEPNTIKIIKIKNHSIQPIISNHSSHSTLPRTKSHSMHPVHHHSIPTPPKNASIASQPFSKQRTKTMKANNSEVQFALDLVQLILTNVKQLNPKIPKKTLKCLNDTKQQKIVIESILNAPIIAHLVKSCICSKRNYQKQQNYLQLLSFFIDYFQQIYPNLIWPKAQRLILNIDNNTNQKKKLQQKNISTKVMEQTTKSQKKENEDNIETPNNAKSRKKCNSDKKDEAKFDEFINKINEIGNKFEMLQNSTKDNKKEICQQIKNIQCKQQEFDKKLTNKNNKNKSFKAQLTKNWEDSHHHLGKKQQENIDLLEHQTQKFENIAMRIQDALKQTEDPKIFQKRLNFITEQTKYLEQKLDEVQESMTNKAMNLEQTVKIALNKYKEMENMTDLISFGVSPHNVLRINDNIQNNKTSKKEQIEREKEKESETKKMNKEEQKLSFLYKMARSGTGFNYEQKKVEIKNIIKDVLECKHKIDHDQNRENVKTLKMKIKKQLNTEQNDEVFEIEDDEQFMDRIKRRIQSTMTMIQNSTFNAPPSLKVHWNDDQKKMDFIKDDDLDKLMFLKPGIARKYRQNQKENKNISVPPIPSIDNILQKATKNMKTRKIKTLINASNEMLSPFISTKPIKGHNMKIIRRTTQKPPELQFHSKPIPP